jgi:hypothetical protein
MYILANINIRTNTTYRTADRLGTYQPNFGRFGPLDVVYSSEGENWPNVMVFVVLTN